MTGVTATLLLQILVQALCESGECWCPVVQKGSGEHACSEGSTLSIIHICAITSSRCTIYNGILIIKGFRGFLSQGDRHKHHLLVPFQGTILSAMSLGEDKKELRLPLPRHFFFQTCPCTFQSWKEMIHCGRGRAWEEQSRGCLYAGSTTRVLC